MGTLQDKLNAAKAQKNNKANTAHTAQTHSALTENIHSKDVDYLDNLVFGAPTVGINEDIQYEMYPNNQKREVYDAEKEMRDIKNGGETFSNSGNSKMPKAILESIMNNPLTLSPIENSETESLSEEVQSRTLDILNKLDERDKQGKIASGKETREIIEETVSRLSNNRPTINEDIVSLIENMIDKKLSQFSNKILNETKLRNNIPNTTLMRLGENLTFMDSDNNVFECKLVYKGKGKIKK